MSRRPATYIALLGAGLRHCIRLYRRRVLAARPSAEMGGLAGRADLSDLTRDRLYRHSLDGRNSCTDFGNTIVAAPPVSRRASLGRRLLVCVSLLLSLVAAESASIIWQRRANRVTAMPIGGLQSGQGWRTTSLPTEDSVPTPAAVTLPLDFADPPGDREIDLVTVGESRPRGSVPTMAFG